MVTITQGATTLAVEMVTGYEARCSSTTVLHRIIGRAAPDVTLAAPGLRQGQMDLWCSSLPVAQSLVALHARTAIFALADTEFPSLDMVYAVAGSVTLAPEMGTARWIVTVDFAEVTP